MEVEVFVKIGAWKNIEDLEENVSLPELDVFLKGIRDATKDERIFLAAMQGVDLTKHYNNPVEDKKREIERRAAERLAGSAEELERQEFADFGIEVIVD